jgi:hypothetical protein
VLPGGLRPELEHALEAGVEVLDRHRDDAVLVEQVLLLDARAVLVEALDANAGEGA